MEEKLIEAVRDYPCLWQVSAKSYKDLRVKENAWKEVAETVGEGVTHDDCTRWKTLRDKFVREMKKVKKKKSGEEGPEYVSCWPYFQSMMFLSDTIKHRSTSSNFGTSSSEQTQAEEDTVDADADTNASTNNDEPLSPGSLATSNTTTSTNTSSVSSPSCNSATVKVSRKSKRKADDVDELLVKTLQYSLQEESKKVSAHEMDEEGHYGEQIAATLRRFTPRQAALAKMRIQELVFNVEFGSEPTQTLPIP